MNKKNSILEYLKECFPNPTCELNYTCDYELLISIMLSAQTTDKKVNIVTKELFKKYDSIEKLATANKKDIIEIIKSIGFANKKSNFVIEIAKIINNGADLKKREVLESMPGVGRKTASVFLSEFYEIPNIAVDTHVHRFSKRMGIIKETDDVLICEQKLKIFFDEKDYNRMHLTIVLFGRYICKSKNPDCNDCKLKSYCKYWQKK
ncbi:MAG: endonuclease III domain-containing protein [Bacilli bacterium]